jgi:hypothetical protein
MKIGIDPAELIHVRDNIYKKRFTWRGKSANRYFIETNCFTCGAEFFRDRDNSRKGDKGFCSDGCKQIGTSGPNNPGWGGGKKTKRGFGQGHILIYAPDHPFAKKNFVPEHRAVIENLLGRYLTPIERVHHKNLDMQDNAPANLIVAENNTAHNNIHASLNLCVKELMGRGFLAFNNETLKYEVVK